MSVTKIKNNDMRRFTTFRQRNFIIFSKFRVHHRISVYYFFIIYNFSMDA